jgi:hypothetical protein
VRWNDRDEGQQVAAADVPASSALANALDAVNALLWPLGLFWQTPGGEVSPASGRFEAKEAVPQVGRFEAPGELVDRLDYRRQ